MATRPVYHACIQNTPEWKELTASFRFRGSAVAAMCGLDPHKSRIMCWKELVGLSKPAADPNKEKIFAYGHLKEEEAKEELRNAFPVFDNTSPIHCYDSTFSLDSDGFDVAESNRTFRGLFRNFISNLGSFQHRGLPIVYSPDMLAVDERSPTEAFDMEYYDCITGGVEIKCPWSLKIPEKVPVHHMLQMQTGAEVIGTKYWMYYVYTPSTSLYYPVVRSELAWYKVIWPRLEHFARYLEGKQPPPNMKTREKEFLIRQLAAYCPEMESAPANQAGYFDTRFSIVETLQ